MSVRVSLLGTISARTATGEAIIAGDKQQALLVMLALAAPRSVSDQRLIDQLWGDDPPGNPANALQAQVSSLRRVLGRETVTRESNGYSLRVRPHDVDALELERLVGVAREAAAAGDQHEAALRFGEAVELVSGRPLDGLTERGVARETAMWLENLVIDAHEGRIDALLATGRHAEVVDPLRVLVAARPFRERFHAQLMMALYRCGRQTAALGAYRWARETLLEELGLDPGPELRSLERAILTHDASLAAPVPLAPTASWADLPMPLTSFVGREREIADLHAAIGASRVVTVVGPAGVGKSRLVLEVARELERSRETWYVELAPVTDPVAVPEAVATALGARDDTSPDAGSTPRRPDERLIGRLGDRPAVLILDNCEHIIGAAAQCIRAMVAGCPSLVVVATSRLPLAIDGEVQIPLGTLGETESMQLFADRARAVQPLFRADDVMDDLLELCRHLDGLPLAIELAAARAKALPVAEIITRLEHRFELLKRTDGHAPARHRALRAALDASYDLLFDEERRTFRTLAVFAGGVTVAAAERVCGVGALDVLTALVDRSMLVADTSGPEARFRMLESLRQYGVERLREQDELDEAMAAHLAWCTDLAETVDVEVRGPGQLLALDRLDAEHDNLRAALAHASATDPAAGLRLIGSLLLSWFARDRRQEARHWAEACLTAADDPPPSALALVFAGIGLMPESSGWTGTRGEIESELELAQTRLRRGIELSAAAGDELVLARCRITLLSILTRSAASRITVDPTEIERLIADATAAFEKQGDQFFACASHFQHAIWRLVSGDLAAAESAAERAKWHATSSGDRWSMASGAWLEGLLLDAAGDASGAYRNIERSLRLHDEMGFGHVVLGQANALALLADRLDRTELADQWRAFIAGRLGRSAGGRYDGMVVAAISNRLALDARQAGDLARARQLHLEALAWHDEVGTTPGASFTESCLGFLATAAGDHEAAAAHHARALDAADELGDLRARALALEGVASTFTEGHAQWAAELLGAAWAVYEASGLGPESHRDDVGSTERRARSELGDVAFESAVRKGASWRRVESLTAARHRPDEAASR